MQVAREPVLLLVEDSEDDVFSFTRKFRQTKSPLSLEHVSNGSAAMNLLRQAAAADSLPQIVFLDLKMPVLNGFDVLVWMQKQPFDVPVVVLSGSEEKRDKALAAELGAMDYLVKPVTVDDLQRLLAGSSQKWAENEHRS